VPLNACGVVKPQIAILAGNGLLNIVLALVLAKPYGVLGVAWAFPISAAVTSLWGYPWLIRRHLAKAAGKAAGTDLERGRVSGSAPGVVSAAEGAGA
jgi:Na+-driven multidrug efflux pump